jgi:hypothetical protein
MRSLSLDTLRSARPITSRTHHDMGLDTRSDAPETNLVPSLGVDGWCPAWMCISTMLVYHQGERGRGRPLGAPNKPKALTPGARVQHTTSVPISHRDAT